MGICKLCDSESSLINAHIIPESFHRDLRANEHTLYMIHSNEGRTYKRRIGEYDSKILCSVCDGHVIGPFDAYAIEFFRRECHGNITERDTSTGAGYYYVQEHDYAKLKLFFISLLWRAAVSSRSVFDAISHAIEQASPATDSNEHAPIQMDVHDRGDIIEITLNIAFRSYAGRKIAYSTTQGAVSIQQTNHDTSLITAIVRSYKWNRMIEQGEIKIASDIAKLEGVERTYASDVLRLKYLAPDIVTMIVNGTQPRTLNVSQLVCQKLPLDWQAQKAQLHIG